MSAFTPASAAAGGALIGLAALLLILTAGRIAGISGIVGAVFGLGTGDRAWRAAFLVGLVLAPVATMAAGFRVPMPDMPSHWLVTVVAGLLVGFGARLGGGCTSGHGVCGIARFSRRSVTATLTLMLTAAMTVAVMRHVIG